MIVMEEQKTEGAVKEEAATEAPASKDAKTKLKRKSTARKPAKKEGNVVRVKSRRKSAVARASIKSGSGVIRVNSSLISVVHPEELRRLMLEPISVSDSTRSLAKTADITVSVTGGGLTARAEAVRGAIAKALAGFSNNDIIRKEYLRYDRSMIIDDPRRVEPKKFDGPKARARTQTSYR